jgi:hypothetical protein
VGAPRPHDSTGIEFVVRASRPHDSTGIEDVRPGSGSASGSAVTGWPHHNRAAYMPPLQDNNPTGLFVGAGYIPPLPVAF